MRSVTAHQASDYCKALVTKFHDWCEEMDSVPVVRFDWNDDGHWAILWEEGPFEWACSPLDEVYQGEYDYVAMGVPAIKGVFAEPYYSFVMMLYPEG
jgi:hypothetical protein